MPNSLCPRCFEQAGYHHVCYGDYDDFIVMAEPIDEEDDDA